MKEKTTKGTTELNQGLNEGNPNTERTPIDPRRADTGLIGGVTQGNHEDDVEGTTEKKQKDNENAEQNKQE